MLMECSLLALFTPQKYNTQKLTQRILQPLSLARLGLSHNTHEKEYFGTEIFSN